MTLLQLIKDLDPSFGVIGMMLSQKYDGQRMFWDGGITYGMPKANVPWANTVKDGRYVNDQYCTGLWSRYGHVIHAPDWFINSLPVGVCLDGELYSNDEAIKRGPSHREDILSCTKKLIPVDSEWKDRICLIFEIVPYNLFFTDRQLGVGKQSWGRMNGDDCRSMFGSLGGPSSGLTFRSSCRLLESLDLGPHASVVEQRIVSRSSDVDDLMCHVTQHGGEGIVVRNPDRWWTPRRVDWVRRLKTVKVGSGVVVGVTSGKGRLDGMIGALILDSGLKIAGMSDEERSRGADHWIGTTVTYTYREVTKYGVPQEARLS